MGPEEEKMASKRRGRERVSSDEESITEAISCLGRQAPSD